MSNEIFETRFIAAVVDTKHLRHVSCIIPNSIKLTLDVLPR